MLVFKKINDCLIITSEQQSQSDKKSSNRKLDGSGSAANGLVTAECDAGVVVHVVGTIAEAAGLVEAVGLLHVARANRVCVS